MAGTISFRPTQVGVRFRCLNGVRPRWPEQWEGMPKEIDRRYVVSMESGLDGRNNHSVAKKSGIESMRSQWSPA